MVASQSNATGSKDGVRGTKPGVREVNIIITPPPGADETTIRELSLSKNESFTGMEDDESSKFTFGQVVGLNIMNMFGTGPLITIPYCVAAVNPMGPHAIWGYGVACVACICDSFVWGEIGSMWPESGGPYVYLRELYGPNTWGRLVSWMFVWQFFISGPAEAASGFIAIAEYLTYFTPSTVTYGYRVLISFCLIGFCSLLLARSIHDIGNAGLVMAGITVFAMIFCIFAGFTQFDTDNLASPPDAWKTAGNGLWIIAFASRFGIYDMTGYYDVCFMGGEVQNPKRTIPLSCVYTCGVVAIIYLLCYIAVLGCMPWQGFIEMFTDHFEGTPVGIMSLFTEYRFGSVALAQFMTIIVAITIFGSSFAMLVGFICIPPAAARDGYFYSAFAPKDSDAGSLSPISLWTIIALTCFFSLFDMGFVIDVMCCMYVLVMFCGQSAGLMYYRYTTPEDQQPEGWRMPLFPLPCIVQFVIFFFVFLTTDNSSWDGAHPILEVTLGFLAIGAILFLIRSRTNKTWPFNIEIEDDADMDMDAVDDMGVDCSPTAKLATSPTAYVTSADDIMLEDDDEPPRSKKIKSPKHLSPKHIPPKHKKQNHAGKSTTGKQVVHA